MRRFARAAAVAAAMIPAILAAAAAGTLPRPEYPRPEMVRAEWLNLNGEWDFALDLSASGEERGLPGDPFAAFRASGYEQRIAEERVGGHQMGWGA